MCRMAFLRTTLYRSLIVLTVVLSAVFAAGAQQSTRSYPVAAGAQVEVVNRVGTVTITVEDRAVADADADDAPASGTREVTVRTSSSGTGAESDLKVENASGSLRITVDERIKRRVDLMLTMPSRMRVRVTTADGSVLASGNFRSLDVVTETGTIGADVPVADLRYAFLWTASRPRIVSDVTLEKAKEKAAGKFEIAGKYTDVDSEKTSAAESPEDDVTDDKTKAKTKGKDDQRVQLQFRTDRGIVLLNVPPDQVTSDLRSRPLTVAAKAIIRSGDSLLMEAIRRAAPEYYSDYTRTLPPVKLEPDFAERSRSAMSEAAASVKTASISVTDAANRAVTGLTAGDIEVSENGRPRQVLSVSRSNAPVNLVLLLDVSGSIENYVNFIRKAARSFVDTMDPRDRISIVTFNDDVHVLSRFTPDKQKLSDSLDSFDAGGATAYYDALAYVLAESIRPMKGQRTAIVVLTDGDDNRSFLAFDPILGAIQESGALVYPLYVPSGLIAAESSALSDRPLDQLRDRYLGGELSSKAKAEGEQLARVSGGTYFPISRLSQIQGVYDEIAAQLRTAYDVEFRSMSGDDDGSGQSGLKIRSKRPNTLVQVRSVTKKQ